MARFGLGDTGFRHSALPRKMRRRDNPANQVVRCVVEAVTDIDPLAK